MPKYKDYLENGKGNIKHIILSKKSEFRSRFNHFWDTWISTWIALPYFVIGLLLYLLYRYSNSTTIAVICSITMLLLIPLAFWVLWGIKGTIEDYIFDEFIFPQIEQKYIKDEHKDFDE